MGTESLRFIFYPTANYKTSRRPADDRRLSSGFVINFKRREQMRARAVELWKCPVCKNEEDIYFVQDKPYWDDPGEEYKQKCQCPKCKSRWSVIFRATRIEKERADEKI